MRQRNETGTLQSSVANKKVQVPASPRAGQPVCNYAHSCGIYGAVRALKRRQHGAWPPMHGRDKPAQDGSSGEWSGGAERCAPRD
jgi:hypothetical protein